MLGFVKLTLVTFGLLYGAALTGIYAFQRDLQYFPTRRDPAPQALGLQGVDRVALTAPDGTRLVLWLSRPEHPRAPVILFLHGNAGEIADRADRLAFYRDRGFGVAFLSWRGYGGSGGRPSEAGLLLDAQTAYDHLRDLGIAPGRIAVVGESLGTGPAVMLAAKNPVGAMILEAPYSAAVDIARSAYPWAPVGLLMKDQFRTRDHIAGIGAPLLILHGEADKVIPAGHGRRLYDLAPQPKTFRSLGPVGHDALFSPATWAIEADFIARSIGP
ncbi:alpha/beta hydrolase [Rhodobacter calidifons]|uniref:Alpha/beta hydrolase n=1 Tax=Rhodobacter calidifons TaxID=2715277 RepID=A0ABX0G8C0_9RHOB|nr:alpha/beta hydrolase [Rhodobacter calidifons]NHB77114.1 alpha/beta hydrolase [Rhodobacter calidifons]